MILLLTLKNCSYQSMKHHKFVDLLKNHLVSKYFLLQVECLEKQVMECLLQSSFKSAIITSLICCALQFLKANLQVFFSIIELICEYLIQNEQDFLLRKIKSMLQMLDIS